MTEQQLAAMRQALESLENVKSYDREDLYSLSSDIAALRAAIEQAEKAQGQEPHSWYSPENDEWMTNKTRKEHKALNSYTHRVGGFGLPLYTAPPAAQPSEWVGLTDEEIIEVWPTLIPPRNATEIVRAIAAKLREKNTQKGN